MIAIILRVKFPEAISVAVSYLKFWIGATNTAVLIVSSFTMSLAIVASRLDLRSVMIKAIFSSPVLGALFVALKGSMASTGISSTSSGSLCFPPFMLSSGHTHDQRSKNRFWSAMRGPAITFISLISLHALNVSLGEFMTCATVSIVELGIALTMGAIVLLFSMETLLGTPVIRLFSVIGFYWLSIHISMTFMSYIMYAAFCAAPAFK